MSFRPFSGIQVYLKISVWAKWKDASIFAFSSESAPCTAFSPMLVAYWLVSFVLLPRQVWSHRSAFENLPPHYLSEVPQQQSVRKTYILQIHHNMDVLYVPHKAHPLCQLTNAYISSR